MRVLLYKDFKLLFGSNKSVKARAVALLTKLLFLLSFIAIFLFLLTSILNKIKNVDNAPDAFMSFALEIISILLSCSFVIRGYKLFFNKNDIQLTQKFPIKTSKIILSKLIFLFVTYYGLAFLFTFPLFISYGIITKARVTLFCLAIIYPIITFFLDMGIALLLLIPYAILKKKLATNIIAKFIIYLIFLSGFVFLYSRVLDVFVRLVAGGDLNVLFTTDVIDKFIFARKFEISSSPYMHVVSGKEYIYLSFGLVNFVVFLIGLFSIVAYYKRYTNYVSNDKVRKIKHNYKTNSTIVALMKKELSILTKNDNYIISFACLLIIQPFLAYLIIYAMNLIFRSGKFAYYISVVPNFIVLLDILLLILFSLMINQGATNYISMEEKTISIMKTIPVRYKTQLILKLIIPYTLSMASFIITDIVLLITKLITIDVALVSIILVGLILFIYDSICLYEELRMKNNKGRNSTVSSLYSTLLPLVFFVTSILLTCIGVRMWAIYAIGVLLMGVLGIYFLIKTYKNMERDFLEIENIRKNYN